MDTYSYISENGTVRQIEDLIAKARNEEQDTEIAANRTAINALTASVENSLKMRVRTLNPRYFEGNNEKEFLSNAVKAAKTLGALENQGQAVMFPGGWSGRSYGAELIQKISDIYYTVMFLGQEFMLCGVYDGQNDNFPSLAKYTGQLL